uniref:Gfo/Idh/MocA family protein n=1 Tax=Algoriphagus sp. TaxID=1872435 RepID=UPI0040477AE6
MNVLIIGLGSIAKKHINSLYILNCNAVIFALRSNNNAVQDGQIINLYSLENLEITFDFVIISNPTNLHYKFIKIFAEKGIPLFIEKPPLHSLDNCEELISLLDSKKIISYVACNLRFHPCILFVKHYFKSGSQRINEVNVYCGSFLPDWRPGKDFRETYSSDESMGGGVHLDLFHELDYLVWFFGLPLQSSSIKRNVSSLAINSVDYANYSLQYGEFTANVVLNYFRKTPKRVLEIVFDDHIILVDLIKNIVFNEFDEILFESPKFKLTDTYNDQMSHFIHCVKNNTETLNTFKNSIDVLKIVLKNDR